MIFYMHDSTIFEKFQGLNWALEPEDFTCI